MNEFKLRTFERLLISKYDFISNALIFESLNSEKMYEIVLTYKYFDSSFPFYFEIDDIENIRTDSFIMQIQNVISIFDLLFLNSNKTYFNSAFFRNVYMGKYLLDTQDRRFTNLLMYSERVESISSRIEHGDSYLENLFNNILNTDIEPFSPEELKLSFSNYMQPDKNPNLRERISLTNPIQIIQTKDNDANN